MSAGVCLERPGLATLNPDNTGDEHAFKLSSNAAVLDKN